MGAQLSGTTVGGGDSQMNFDSASSSFGGCCFPWRRSRSLKLATLAFQLLALQLSAKR